MSWFYGGLRLFASNDICEERLSSCHLVHDSFGLCCHFLLTFEDGFTRVNRWLLLSADLGSEASFVLGIIIGGYGLLLLLEVVSPVEPLLQPHPVLVQLFVLVRLLLGGLRYQLLMLSYLVPLSRKLVSASGWSGSGFGRLGNLIVLSLLDKLIEFLVSIKDCYNSVYEVWLHLVRLNVALKVLGPEGFLISLCKT